MITEGIFAATVKSHSWMRSQAGTTGLSVTVALSGGTTDGEEMTGTIWFSPLSMRIGRAQLKALGFDVDTKPLKSIGKVVSLVGAKCRVQIKNEEYRGESQLKIGFFMPESDTPPEADLDFIERGLRAVKSAPTKATSQKPQTSRSSPADAGADEPNLPDNAGGDIPF